MADQTPIMPPAAFEVSRTSEIGAHFCNHLMPAITAYTVAERDLEDVAGGFDPAYLMYEVEADVAREGLVAALHENLGIRIGSPTDCHLHRMAMLIDALISAEDVGTFKELHRNMHHSFSRLFQSNEDTRTAKMINVVLNDASHLVDALVALPIFERWSDEELAIYHQPDSEPFTSRRF